MHADLVAVLAARAPGLIVAALAIGACRAPENDQVVFVCEHGAAKSVLAATTFNQIAAARGLHVRAIARGADPQDAPSRATLDGLRADGLAPATDPPRPLTADDVRRSSRVIAFDCGAPTMRALRSLDACWDDVPTVADDYPRARGAIRAHVAALLDARR